MTALKTLRAVRELLADEERWTQNYLARDEFDQPVAPGSTSATCWCLTGAIMRTGGAHMADALLALAMINPLTSVPAYNDSHIHAEVLQLLNDTINREEQRESRDES